MKGNISDVALLPNGTIQVKVQAATDYHVILERHMARYASPEQIKTGIVGYGGAFEMGKHHLLEMQSKWANPEIKGKVNLPNLGRRS